MEQAVFRRFMRERDMQSAQFYGKALLRNLQSGTIKVILEAHEGTSQRPQQRERKADALPQVRRRSGRRFIAPLLEAGGVELPTSWCVLGAAYE